MSSPCANERNRMKPWGERAADDALAAPIRRCDGGECDRAAYPRQGLRKAPGEPGAAPAATRVVMVMSFRLCKLHSASTAPPRARIGVCLPT